MSEQKQAQVPVEDPAVQNAVATEVNRLAVDIRNALDNSGGAILDDPKTWPARIEAFVRAFARGVYGRPRPTFFDSAVVMIGFAAAPVGVLIVPALTPAGVEGPALAELNRTLAGLGRPIGHLVLQSALWIPGPFAGPARVIVLSWSVGGAPDVLYARASLRADGSCALDPWTSNDPRLPAPPVVDPSQFN